MIDSTIVSFVREEVRRQVQILMSGTSGENTHETESIEQMVPGMPTIAKRPIMHPYGFVSRAARGTVQVVGRMGDHASNRFVMGHRDKDRPVDLKEGEGAIYSVGKYQVRVLTDRIQIGKEGVFETLVLGDKLTSLLGDLITELGNHTHTCSVPGGLSTPPFQKAQIDLLKTEQVDGNKLLAEDGGGF